MVGQGLRNGEAGYSLIEALVTTAIMTIVMGIAFQGSTDLFTATQRDSTQSYVTTRARAAMDSVVRMLRRDFVEFNVVTGKPLGVNFDLNDGGKPLVRDGMLFYTDANFTAQLGGEPFHPGFDDVDNDDKADVIGIGLVAQDIDGDGTQDFVDLEPKDDLPDDLDKDGVADPLWTLMMVRFKNINEVSTAALWRDGRALTTNVYVRRLNKAGALTGANIATFQFSSHNSLAMWADSVDLGGNADNDVSEAELGNMTTKDGIINDANEVGAIDSMTVTLNVVEVTNQGLGRIVVLSGDISSDLITPRNLLLMRRNGVVGLPDPGAAGNVD